MKFVVKYDDREIRQALLRLRGDAPLAIARACNRSIATVQTQAVRAIATDVGIPQREVRKVMGLVKATRVSLRAVLDITGKRLSLKLFKPRKAAGGLSYRLPGGRGFLPGGFIARMRSGHEGAFVRTGRFGRRGNPRLEKIAERRGPSLPHVFAKAAIRAAMVRVARDVMPKNLLHEIRFLLRGRA